MESIFKITTTKNLTKTKNNRGKMKNVFNKGLIYYGPEEMRILARSPMVLVILIDLPPGGTQLISHSEQAL